MSVGQLGVLHTYSAYVTAPILPQASEDERLKQLKLQIDMLKDKEDAFAKRFGYGSIEDFIKGVREILGGNPADLHALQQFSSTNLRAHLEQFKSETDKLLVGLPVTIRFEAEQAKAQKIFDKVGGNSTIQWEMDGPDNLFTLKWDTAVIKSVLNKISSKHYQRESTNIKAMMDYLRNEAEDIVRIEVGGTGGQSIQEYLVENTVSPFGLTQDELKDLQKRNPEVFNQIKERINNFIYKDLCAGASDEFIRAVDKVLGSKKESLIDYTFFMGGNGWVTHAVGAFGELQTAIMFQYISNKTPNKLLATTIANIIGDDWGKYEGQQAHTDIKLLEGLGIQVKNYSGSINQITHEERSIVVNLHPTEVGALSGGEGIADYIVNSYFNTSVGQYPASQLDEFFKAHASELLNLDLNPQIGDQVSFYMIGGNFIPGSVLLTQAFVEISIKVETTITGTEGDSDEGYNEWLSDPNAWNNPFIEWWHSDFIDPPQKGAFTPQPKNLLGTWDKNVSIHTKFTYSALFDGTYSLF